MKNYEQIQAQLSDISDMIAAAHEYDLQQHRNKLKQAEVSEQSDKEMILTQTVSRATGMVEAIIKNHISNKNYMEACAQLDNLIWLHKELPLGSISEKWVKEYTEQREEVMKTAVYTSH